MKKVVRILSFAVLLLFLLIPIQVKAAEKQMYCLYNPANKEYLYTVDENERNNLLSVWEDKGVICSLPAYSNTPVYRLYDPMSTQHLYTSDDSEITKLVSEGWKKEGIAYYVDDAHTVPIYRLFKSSTGEHQFAGDANSIAALEKEGWIKEGVAWYALSTLTEGNTSEKKETIDIHTGDRYRLEDEIKPEEDGYGGFAGAMLAKVNALRREQGVGELTLDEQCKNVSAIRVVEISSLYSHTRPDGRKSSTTWDDLGYQWSGVGENIAKIGNYNTTSSLTQKADEFYNLFKYSPSHYSCMINSKWKKAYFNIYITYEEDGETVYHCVQTFSK